MPMSEFAAIQGQLLARQGQLSQRLATLEEEDAWYGVDDPPEPEGVFDREAELATAIGSETQDGRVCTGYPCLPNLWDKQRSGGSAYSSTIEGVTPERLRFSRGR